MLPDGPAGSAGRSPVSTPGWSTSNAAPVPGDGETVGELEVRGPTLMDGYLNQPEATAALYTPDGWLRTGDVACVDQDGWHRIVGRQSTDLIKSGGYRVGAGEVEAALLAHPAVQEAAVIGEPDDDLGQAIVAFVVADGVTGPELCDFVAGTFRCTSGPAGWSWSTPCPATPWARCRRPDCRVADGPGVVATSL